MGNPYSGWFTETINIDRVYKFDIGIYVFTLLYTTIFLLLTIYKLWWGKPNQVIFKSIRFLSTIHSVFYLAYFIVFYPDTDVNTAAINRIISYVMLMLAQLSFYLLMTLRLYQTFTATIYALSPITINLFQILFIVLFVAWMMWFCRSLYIDKLAKNVFMALILSSILGLSCLYGFSLISLFVNKLFKLALSQRQSIHIFNDKRITSSLSFSSFNAANYDNYVDYSRSQSKTKSKSKRAYYATVVELNERQKYLVSTIVKNSMLGIIAIVLYQCLFALAPIIIGDDYRMEVMYKFLFALAIFFEMLCIFLSFKANDNLYMCLCGKCHKCCENWCKRIVSKKITKLNQKAIDLYTSQTILEEVSLSNMTSINEMSLDNDVSVYYTNKTAGI